jgi:hypothetical protein
VVVVTILITTLGWIPLYVLPPLGGLAAIVLGHPVGTLSYYVVSALLAVAIVRRLRLGSVAAS